MATAKVNERAVIGDNTQAEEYGKRVSEQIARDYAELALNVGKMLNEARELPERVENEEQLGTFSSLVKKMRDACGRVEAFRVAEKEPYLRGGNAVDSFFFGLHERLARRSKSAKAGAADILQARIDAYQQAKVDAERERRRKEAEEAAKIERELLEAAIEARRKAEAAEEAAARARRADTVVKREQEAQAAEAEAERARAEARAASQAADEAQASTQVKAADLARTRFDDGTLVTMKQVGYVEILDRDKLDRAKLWPFIKDEHLLQALKAWAKVTNHKQKMDGAVVELRNESVVR